MIKVKICGITNLKDAMSAIDLGADALGFIFAKSLRKISQNKATQIINKLPPYIAVVGVFVDEDERKVINIAKICKLDYVQLHGNESPEFCNRLGLKVIKTIKIFDRNIKKYKVNGFLVDTYDLNKKGGTGKLSDWNLANRIKKIGIPVILSGGLTPENVTKAIRKVKPYAVDVSSGVERYPGNKDYKKMKKFIGKVKSITNLINYDAK